MINIDASIETDDLLRRIRTMLHSQRIPTLRQLAVEVNGDTAVIEGKVGSFYERQVGIECCKRVAGVRTVVDHICVEPQREPYIPEN